MTEEKYPIDEKLTSVICTILLRTAVHPRTIKRLTVLCVRGLNYEQPSLVEQGAITREAELEDFRVTEVFRV